MLNLFDAFRLRVKKFLTKFDEITFLDSLGQRVIKRKCDEKGEHVNEHIARQRLGLASEVSIFQQSHYDSKSRSTEFHLAVPIS